jgi:lipoate-protein ligase A
MNRKSLLVIDSGVMEGRLNIAMGQALIEARQNGDIADTLRFLRFPPTVLIGRHQALHQEVNLDYCLTHSVGVSRRITGGGAIFLDQGQLGWELVLDRKTLAISSLAELTREICVAAANGLSRLGIEATYRPRNDIEVEGRKISGTGGFFDGSTLFFQGTVLVDMNPDVMISALRVPRAKLAKRQLDSAAQRVVTLKQLMGDEAPGLEQIKEALVAGFCERFGLQAELVELPADVRDKASVLHEEEIGRDDFVTEIDEPELARGVMVGQQVSPGGTVTAFLRLEGALQDRVREVLFTGDFFVTPPRIIYDLESALRGVRTADLEPVITGLFEAAKVDVLSVAAADFIAAVRQAMSNSNDPSVA